MNYDKNQIEEKAMINIADQVNEMGFIWRPQPIKDVGIDGQIETKDERKKPTGKLIAVQSKGGMSYIKNEKANKFTYYADLGHVKYWKNYSLPVLIIVYHPKNDKSYWVDVQNYLEQNPLKLSLKSYPFRILKSNVLCPDSKDEFIKIASKKTKEILESFLPHPPQPYFAHPYPLQKNFTGRENERKQLTDWLIKDPRPTLVYVAIGGMGKTALTWYWLQEDIIKQGLAPEGIIWWSFYDKESSFDTFANNALKYITEGKVDPKNLSSKDKLQSLYNLLYQKRFLVVLDGLERILRAYAGLGSPYQGDEFKKDPQQTFRSCIDPGAAWFLQAMNTGSPQSRILITSRLFPKELDGLAGCVHIDLKSMKPADAVKFFHTQCVKGTRAEIQAACELYGYHPLKLRLLSGLILEDKENPGDCSQSKYCEIGDVAPKEHYIMEISYDALDKEKQDFISSLAAFRAPMDYPAINGISKFKSKQELDGTLTELVNRGLLFWDKEKNRYDLHPIVRSYSYDRLRDKEDVHSQLRDYFASVPEPDKIESIDDLQPVIELYHHTVRAGRYEEAWKLYEERLFGKLFYHFGTYLISIQLLLALLNNEDLPKLEKNQDKASLLNILGLNYSNSGQSRLAIEPFKLAIKVYNNCNENMHVAIILENASDDFMKLGRFMDAEINLNHALEIINNINNEFDSGFWKGVACQEQGRLMIYEGKFTKSKHKMSEATNLFMISNHLKFSKVYNYLSNNIYLYQSLYNLFNNNADIVPKHLKNVLKLEDFKISNRNMICAHWLLGASLVALKDLVRAEEILQFAITECRKINMVDHEAAILLEIAKLRHLQTKRSDSRLSESFKLAEEALEIANRCGYVLQQADIHLFLAEYNKDLGDIEKARKECETAIERCRQKINVETGDYEYKDNEKYWYVPCYNKATKLLVSLK